MFRPTVRHSSGFPESAGGAVNQSAFKNELVTVLRNTAPPDLGPNATVWELEFDHLVWEQSLNDPGLDLGEAATDALGLAGNDLHVFEYFHYAAMELVKNASDSIVQAGRQTQALIGLRVSFCKGDDSYRTLQFSVSDNGKGISPEISPLLYRALFCHPKSLGFEMNAVSGFYEVAPPHFCKSGRGKHRGMEPDGTVGGDGAGLLTLFSRLKIENRRQGPEKITASVGFINKENEPGAIFWFQLRYRPNVE